MGGKEGGRDREREGGRERVPFPPAQVPFLVIPIEDRWGQSPWRRPGLPNALAVLSLEKELM